MVRTGISLILASIVGLGAATAHSAECAGVSFKRLQFSFKPGAGLRVAVNGTTKGTISGDDLVKAFLPIWLGVSPQMPSCGPECSVGNAIDRRWSVGF